MAHPHCHSGLQDRILGLNSLESLGVQVLSVLFEVRLEETS
jgi:hypothetical protein